MYCNYLLALVYTTIEYHQSITIGVGFNIEPVIINQTKTTFYLHIYCVQHLCSELWDCNLNSTNKHISQ